MLAAVVKTSSVMEKMEKNLLSALENIDKRLAAMENTNSSILKSLQKPHGFE